MGGHSHYRPTKYHSLKDIPDSMIKQYSERDPNNLIYKTRRWVNFKKMQMLYSQQDGVPIHLRTPLARAMYYTCWAGAVGMFVTNLYLYKKHFK